MIVRDRMNPIPIVRWVASRLNLKSYCPDSYDDLTLTPSTATLTFPPSFTAPVT